jgi:signal transduction histidine kinase
MLRDIEKKFIIIQVILLGFFAWGVGVLYVVTTPLFNAEQLRWAMFCFAWEGLAFAVPLILFRPMFRPIRHYVEQLEGGGAPTPAQVSLYHRRVLAYPFKVSVLVLVACIVAYSLGVWQLRTFAQLPWEAVVITLLCGVTSGLLWAVMEYFLLEYYLRPLTGLAAAVAESLPPPAERVALQVKIFLCSLALVFSSLSFFGVAAYTRAAHVLEEEIGRRVTGRMRELANLISALPDSTHGMLSDSWRWLAAEFPVSPRGYFHIVDATGRIIATHPVHAETGKASLREEQLLPSLMTQVLVDFEGYLTDRVDHSKIVSFVSIPGKPLKVVAIAPLRDFSPQLDQLLYSGLAGMGFALLLALIIGFLSARSITTSLGEVTRVARAVAEKRDLRQRVTFLTNDEVGVLAHAFNQMAEGLQTYSEGLERLVSDRTAELERRGEQLATKNAELSDFLYVASHDLRSPLINLAGFSRALQESVATLDALMGSGNHNGQHAAASDAASRWPALKVEIDESLDFILRSVAKMDTLVNTLLELSRIETRAHVERAVDTAKMMDEVLGAFHYQITEKKIRVGVAPLPVISGDAVRLNQVFSNLIDNAIKYMGPCPDPCIDVGCDARGDVYRFFVRDTGLGIRPEDRDKVFRLFTRVGNHSVAGDGVGLAAVRKIVEKHGGKIWVESEPGAGSTFYFTLPRPTDAAVASSA